MKAPPSAIQVLRIILTSLYIPVNIRYGNPTVSQRKRISHESRGADSDALAYESLAAREHILGFDALFGLHHSMIREDVSCRPKGDTLGKCDS